jgi:hypothetical protein
MSPRWRLLPKRHERLRTTALMCLRLPLVAQQLVR